MRRRLFNLGAAVSMVLCIAMAGLWVRSYWVSDWVAVIHRHAPMRTSAAGAVTWSGSVAVYVVYATPSDYSDPRDTLFQRYSQPADDVTMFPFDRSVAGSLGFAGSMSDGNIQLIAPSWVVVLVSGAAAALSLRRARRLRRVARAGLCPTCGYDLRATPERCPECGKVSCLSLPKGLP